MLPIKKKKYTEIILSHLSDCQKSKSLSIHSDGFRETSAHVTSPTGAQTMHLNGGGGVESSTFQTPVAFILWASNAISRNRSHRYAFLCTKWLLQGYSLWHCFEAKVWKQPTCPTRGDFIVHLSNGIQCSHEKRMKKTSRYWHGKTSRLKCQAKKTNKEKTQTNKQKVQNSFVFVFVFNARRGVE